MKQWKLFYVYMKKLTKNQKKFLNLYDYKKEYSIEEAVNIVKKITYTKFDSSFDIAVRLGIDPSKSDQNVRGTVVLPHGIGKTKTVLVICSEDKYKEAQESGADYFGCDEYLTKIKNGWLDFDVLVTIPSLMAKVGMLGKILGPKGLMPNLKTGTVTSNISTTVDEIKKGRIEFRADKLGIIHTSLGKISFPSEHLLDNAKELISNLIKVKPSTAKGTYIKSISVSSTMSKGIKCNVNSLI